MGFFGLGFVGILMGGVMANSDGGVVVVVLWWLGLDLLNFFFYGFFLCGFCDCDETFEVGFVRFFDGSTMVLLYMVVPWICCI